MLQVLWMAISLLAVHANDGDTHISVDRVELPAEGLDPTHMTVVLKESISGCRRALNPLVEKNGTSIRIFTRSEAVPCSEKGRTPGSNGSNELSQVARLGNLSRGSYRLQVITSHSRIYKILNVY